MVVGKRGDRGQGIEEHNDGGHVSVPLHPAAQHLTAALTASSSATPRGCLIVNPCSFVRRMSVEAIDLSGLPTIERPVYAADTHAESQHAVVDVPAFGFVHLTPGNRRRATRKHCCLPKTMFCGMSSSKRSSTRRRARWPLFTATSRAATASHSSSPCECRRPGKSQAIRIAIPRNRRFTPSWPPTQSKRQSPPPRWARS